ncbi:MULTISPECIES: SDR family oxidoreductase [unclassified Aeromicrobium]|uniref:SDR family NAD(P)-dependent oxidoreductase n=1 Tax=unclassified Aeromicrobium TaxID=2633570 RepID=UPI0020976BAF|nr:MULTISPECIES: SDR family NAD(P)-dependent oxidoreductase [unclassified Aeromicrobium]MCO7240588.1 SDR family NAD(P)-dependent oxidoreductase [Aeromicrobium sp. CnD17-E]
MTRALVTGATAGIGLSFARALAARGDDVVLLARDEQRLEQLATELRGAHGVQADVVVADLTTADGLAAAEAALASTTAPVDLLVNNAGASLAGWFGTTDVADEDRQLDLLVRAPMHLMDTAIKSMVGRGRGQVVNVASVAAFTPRGTYSAHKAWLVNLSQWADWHYASSGVRVMVLCPGFVRTEFHQRADMDISGVPRWMWLNSDKLVAAALADLERGRTVSVPSLRYKVLATLARHAPTSLVARAAKRGR